HRNEMPVGGEIGIGEFDPLEFDAVAAFQRLCRALAGLIGQSFAADRVVHDKGEQRRIGNRGGGRDRLAIGFHRALRRSVLGGGSEERRARALLWSRVCTLSATRG